MKFFYLTIQDMMEHIFREGIFLEGIFRKSPKVTTVKSLKERLDRGEDVQFLKDQFYPTVTASVLKDFLRNIPGRLLQCNLYQQWVDICDLPDETRKLEHVKR